MRHNRRMTRKAIKLPINNWTTCQMRSTVPGLSMNGRFIINGTLTLHCLTKQCATGSAGYKYINVVAFLKFLLRKNNYLILAVAAAQVLF
jgi:hypothetical protein